MPDASMAGTFAPRGGIVMALEALSLGQPSTPGTHDLWHAWRSKLQPVRVRSGSTFLLWKLALGA